MQQKREEKRGIGKEAVEVSHKMYTQKVTMWCGGLSNAL